MYFCKDEIHISQIDITQVNQYENDFHLMETTFLTHKNHFPPFEKYLRTNEIHIFKMEFTMSGLLLPCNINYLKNESHLKKHEQQVMADKVRNL